LDESAHCTPPPSCARLQIVESSRLATSRLPVAPTETDEMWWYLARGRRVR